MQPPTSAPESALPTICPYPLQGLRLAGRKGSPVLRCPDTNGPLLLRGLRVRMGIAAGLGASDRPVLNRVLSAVAYRGPLLEVRVRDRCAMATLCLTSHTLR